MFLMRTIPVGPLQCNCQILVDTSTGSAALVDPGDEANTISSAIIQIEKEIQKPIKLEFMFHTHAHFDHFGATRKLRETSCKHAKICLHSDDHFLYSKLTEQGRMFGHSFEDPLPVDRFLNHQEEVQVGAMQFECIHTPGHSPGGLAYRLKENSAIKIPEIVFSGDTLFFQSVGRTDLWGGDEQILKKSIQERLFNLDDDTLVWPGHGPSTSVGFEKRENPYVSI